MLLITHTNAAFSCLESVTGGGGAAVSNCISGNNKRCCRGGQEAPQAAFRPVASALTSLMPIPEKCHHSRVLSAGGVYSHTGRRPEQQQQRVTLNVFHLFPDADDELILGTNSIILNNRRRWQAHNKNTSMNELFTSFGARGAACGPRRAKMPLHYGAPESGAARADPVTGGNRILVRVFLGSRRAEADRRRWSLKCPIFLLLAAGCRFSLSFHGITSDGGPEHHHHRLIPDRSPFIFLDSTCSPS